MDYIYKTGSLLNYLNPLAFIPSTTTVENVLVPYRSEIPHRLAGVSGALAVRFGNSPENQKRRSMFSTGAHMHLIHSAALLGLSGCSRPKLSASLFILGVGLFSGTCYYTALTDDYRFVKIAPIGGTVLIIAWLSLLL
ncbi:unnamed protein product [Schistocephalus solidus]|uniref:Transmembrane protein 256 homolog n=1 Tax=Schistocephalus solidus TaxID=70667 RepID=A0A183SGT5_SCHSO|nr:unnamed protein product [Schistocephalus solidus]